jgi:DNA-binding beta-propeller fold protein YncE
MTRLARLRALAATLVVLPIAIVPPATAQMIAPNPYADAGQWGDLPEGRDWGAVSAIYPSPDGQTIWVAERCAANTCANSDLDPILQYDLDGNLLQSFGSGMVLWPHGMFVDPDGNVWVADAAYIGAPTAEGRGHVILKFSPEGDLLMTIGTIGEMGAGPATFNRPSDVLVAPDGSIFVADGHGAGNNNRIVKFDANGNFLMEWGETGKEDGEFRDPHALAMDSQGRLFVGDRANSRIQIFTQDGEHLQTWTQFGRPSGLFIDENDVLYATDSESNLGRNPGWLRGIYIGSAETGWVSAFIPDVEANPNRSGTSAGEGVAVDAEGNVYSAEVGPRQIKKWVRITR